MEAKTAELQSVSAVGADIESVKRQLEEHKVTIVCTTVLPRFLCKA